MEGKILILCYHKIDNIPRDWNNITVSPKQFQEQMEYLKKNYNIIGGDSDWQNLSGDNIVITFDDGYEDFYLNARPVLEKLKIPATVFISSGMAGTANELWCNKLVWLVLEGNEYPPNYKYEKNDLKLYFNTGNILQRLDMYRYLNAFIKTVTPVIKEDIMKSIEEWGNAEKRSRRITHNMLSKEHILEISKSKYITIGCHTVNHPSLGYLSNVEQENEIKSNKEFLENLIGSNIDLFSYPYGGEDSYNMDTVRILKQLGFKRAMAIKKQCCINGYSEYEIPRVSVNECDIYNFASMIEDVFLNNRKVLSKQDNLFRFDFIGKIEDDRELLKQNVKITIWGSGKRGQAVYKRLKDVKLDKKIMCFFESDISKVDSEYEGIPIININEYKYDINMVVIIAIRDVLTITEKVKELKIRSKHFFI